MIVSYGENDCVPRFVEIISKRNFVKLLFPKVGNETMQIDLENWITSFKSSTI